MFFVAFLDFFEIIFQKPLDFFRNRTHTMRAFKLRTNQKKLSTPEILRLSERPNE